MRRELTKPLLVYERTRISHTSDTTDPSNQDSSYYLKPFKVGLKCGPALQHPDMYFTQPMPLFSQSSSLSSDPSDASDETSQPAAADERILSFSHESVPDAEGSHRPSSVPS